MYGSCTQCHLEEDLTPLQDHFLCDSCFIEETKIEFKFKVEDLKELPGLRIGKALMRQHRIYLFRTDPICKLCEQKIENWDEASIDHIIQKAKGEQMIMRTSSLLIRAAIIEKVIKYQKI